jgi:hypothetical protein
MLELFPANFFFQMKKPAAPMRASTKITISAIAQPGKPPSPSLSGFTGTNLSGSTLAVNNTSPVE